jgi:hypothetical protein
MEAQAHLPYRPRPCAVDDRADERRRGSVPTPLFCSRPTSGSDRTVCPRPRRCSCMATSGPATCCGREIVASR